MAITYLGQQQFPATDDANDTGTTLTLDKDVAPFSTLGTNNLVLVFIVFKTGAGTTCSVTTTGGQTWAEDNDSNSNNTNFALYTCFFNGTWTADPVFTTSGIANPRLMWAVAYSGVDTTTRWDVTPVFTAQAASTTFVEATFNTATNGALAIVGAGANDNNTWSVDNSFTAPSGSGNVYWRTSGGTDASIVLCTKSIATAGAVGATTMTQVTLGGDAGARWHGALKPAAAGADQDLTGATFTKAPTFPTGTITTENTLTGTVFAKAPTFLTGTITTETTLTGAVFTKAPTFPQGTLTAEGGEQTLTGAVFTKAPSFPTGTVTSEYTLTGAIFTKAPTFPTGTVTTETTLTGSTFTRAPTFPTGTIATEGGDQTLTGAVFQKAPAFPSGTLALEAPQELTGTVFAKAPTFPQGVLVFDQVLNGATFIKAATFPQGSLSLGNQGDPVKGPTRKGPLAGNDTDSEALTAPVRSELIGVGSNSMEEV